MRVAKLVTVEVTTRVIVEDTATEEEIMTAAMPRLAINLQQNGSEGLVSIQDDIEVPYNGEFDCKE